MRCKNCGFENEPERYICENCGSPLYDEDEDITAQQEGYDDGEPVAEEPDDTDKKNTRNSVIVISVLAVLLAAMIIGIIVFAAQGGKAPEEPSTPPSTTEEAEPSATEPTTAPTTTKPTTTKPTTESTTESTTKETTTEPTTEETTTEPPVAEYLVAVDIDGYGTVTGDGSYKAGEKANLIATPNEGSQFVGWFENGTNRLVASGMNYTVTVQNALSLTARFEELPTQSEEEPPTEEAETEAQNGEQG